MKLIVGLGNPGKEYENTRHNVGFMVLENLQKELEFEDFKEEKKHKSLITQGNYNGEKIILALPQTFMNLSGESVQKITQFYKIEHEDCLVVCDDLDTQFGKLRIRKNGGPGTHNGLKSLVQTIGKDFPRFRFGIESRGQSSHESIDTTSFVLGGFNKEEAEELPEMIKKAVNAIKTALDEGLDAAMNKFNAQNT